MVHVWRLHGAPGLISSQNLGLQLGWQGDKEDNARSSVTFSSTYSFQSMRPIPSRTLANLSVPLIELTYWTVHSCPERLTVQHDPLAASTRSRLICNDGAAIAACLQYHHPHPDFSELTSYCIHVHISGQPELEARVLW